MWLVGWLLGCLVGRFGWLDLVQIVACMSITAGHCSESSQHPKGRQDKLHACIFHRGPVCCWLWKMYEPGSVGSLLEIHHTTAAVLLAQANCYSFPWVKPCRHSGHLCSQLWCFGLVPSAPGSQCVTVVQPSPSLGPARMAFHHQRRAHEQRSLLVMRQERLVEQKPLMMLRWCSPALSTCAAKTWATNFQQVKKHTSSHHQFLQGMLARACLRGANPTVTVSTRRSTFSASDYRRTSADVVIVSMMLFVGGAPAIGKPGRTTSRHILTSTRTIPGALRASKHRRWVDIWI